MVLLAAVYGKRRCFVKRLEPCVTANRFLAIGSRSISNNVVYINQKDCYGCRQIWVEKDRKKLRRRCFGEQMRGGLGGSPFVAWPNLAQLEGRDRITRLGVA